MIMDKERIKVLYVDDEEGNLTAFRASFRREFDVALASNADDALRMLESDQPHVVISDQRMPGITGAEFLTTVRERWPRIIRIMLTGFSDIEAVIDAVNKGGIHAYITKPWDPIDLKLRIEQAFEVHALREEKDKLFDRYRSVFDASGDPIVIVDADGRFHDANPAATRLLGAGRDDLMTAGVREFVDGFDDMVHAMGRQRKDHAFNGVDITLKSRDGRMIDCLMTATYLGRDAEGRPLFQAMVKDITDRKQEEIRLKKLNSDLDKRVAARTKQLIEALDDLGAFSYSVAHDLRSPLKSIRSLSEHLTEVAAHKEDPEVREVTARIQQGTSRLIALVDDLLRFARTDTQQVNRADLDICTISAEAFAAMDTTGRAVELELPPRGEAIVPADPAMFRVVLTNLFSNALKFTRGKEVARIRVHCSMMEGDHVISVSDNGAGFDQAKSGQLFGVFKRLHHGEQFEGTGIGLAIVQRIVQKHGGTCWAEGSLGIGATIHLRLPAKAHDVAFRMAG